MMNIISKIWIPVLVCIGLITWQCRRQPGFTAQERALIAGPDSLMAVCTMPSDSAFLHTPCIDLGPRELQSAQLQTLLAKMKYTVQDPSQDGVGIAAPQVGIGRRIVCVQRLDKPGEPFECYLNIRLHSLWGPMRQGREGCLSVPGLRGLVTRHSGVTVSYIHPGTLQPCQEQVEGFTAVIFQHECDHLDGILYTSKADSLWVVSER